MDITRFVPASFDEIPEQSLLWICREDEPRDPYDLKGPFKKNVFVEMGRRAPEKVFVRRNANA